MEISEKIKIYRGEQSLTQKEFAKLLNVSDKTVSSWERERTYPDLEMIIAISDLIEVPLDNLLRGDDKVVGKITKDTKSGKNRLIKRLVLGGILFILLVIGGLFYQKGMIIDSPKDIKSIKIMSQDGQAGRLVIELNLPFYETYRGHMGSGDNQSDIYEVEVMTGINFFGKKGKSTIEVELPSSETKLKEVRIVDKAHQAINVLKINNN